MSPLPTVPEAITAEWLDGVLSAQNVRAVHMDDVMHGSTTKVFVRAELGDGRLLSFCVKGVFDDPRLPVRVLAAQQEALFFRELAPSLEIRRFRTWFADTDEQQGVVMFDDLRQSGTVFTAAGTAWHPDMVAAALEVQAAWACGDLELPARPPPLADRRQPDPRRRDRPALLGGALVRTYCGSRHGHHPRAVLRSRAPGGRRAPPCSGFRHRALTRSHTETLISATPTWTRAASPASTTGRRSASPRRSTMQATSSRGR